MKLPCMLGTRDFGLYRYSARISEFVFAGNYSADQEVPNCVYLAIPKYNGGVIGIAHLIYPRGCEYLVDLADNKSGGNLMEIAMDKFVCLNRDALCVISIPC